MKKMLCLATLIMFLLASTGASTWMPFAMPSARAQSSADRSWPEYAPGARIHIAGIRTLQRLLNARGFRVKIDATFGPQTKAALIRFQKARGLRQSGVATGATWEKLVIRSKRGSKGQAVRAIQEMLSLIDFPTKPDGVFGSGTERVVKRFQKARDLTPDGVVGPETWSALVMESAMKYE